MSLRVVHLNGDSSFFLIFSPPYAPSRNYGEFPGSFTVLLDPWLVGASTVFSPRFAYTTRNIPACVESLADLPEPDLVLVSQDKPDHCHPETLMQLPPDTGAFIYGPAAATKKIKSWKHFDSGVVHTLPRYEEKQEDTVVRFPIPAPSPTGVAGEVTVSFLAQKMDLAGLHNAISITYRPPATVLSTSAGSFINLPQPSPITPPSTPPTSHRSSRTSLSSSFLRSTNASSLSIGRPRTPLSQPSTSVYSLSPSGPREKAVSVIYSPHGVNYSFIKSFATNHLLSESALPLTALLHSIDRVSNPWYLGGNISAGSKGGLEIARGLSAKCWISAHDEDKDNSGLSTIPLKLERGKRDEIRRMLDDGPIATSQSTDSTSGKKTKYSVKRSGTELVELDAGAEYFIPARN